jgi:hypothetical protein
VIRPPSRIVRRLVLAPLVVLVCLALTALAPLLLAGALVGGTVRRTGLGSTRLVAFGLAYLATEAAMIVALFVLWLASGFGLLVRTPAMQSAHYAVLRGWLRCVSEAAIRLLGLRIEIVDPPPPRPGPLLVFGRHAGVGNSLMMVRTLMLRFGRRPRVVMLGFLQWDPVIDIVGHRLPSLFIEHDPERSDGFVRAIAALATGLGDADAFVLYPEGRDFTEPLRLRAIAHLRRQGRTKPRSKPRRWTACSRPAPRARSRPSSPRPTPMSCSSRTPRSRSSARSSTSTAGSHSTGR